MVLMKNGEKLMKLELLNWRPNQIIMKYKKKTFQNRKDKNILTQLKTTKD